MKIYFAPFHGLGCRQFRLVFMKHFGGFDAVFLPFIPAQQLHQLKQTAMRDIFPKENKSFVENGRT